MLDPDARRSSGQLATASRRVIIVEWVAVLLVIAMIWVDETLDVPNRVFGASRTLINWKEATFESVLVLLIGGGLVLFTTRLLRRVEMLEGLLPMCASCKRIRDEGGRWEPVEMYVTRRSDAAFSHDLCPACVSELYPELNGDS